MSLKIENFDALIFDLGGVLWNINYHATSKAFIDLGFKDFDNWYSQANQKFIFDDLETGKINEKKFFDEIRKVSGLNLGSSQILKAWNSMLLDLPIERIKFLEEVSKIKPIFLLSNTNEIHLKEIETILETQEYPLKKFLSIFNRCYLSCRVGLRKPQPEIFELVLQENNLDKKGTLFIDDSIQHINSANNIGIQTLFLHPPKTILKELSFERK